VSFALVLITTLLGNILKERELAMQRSKQESDLALERAKEASTSLIAENTNLGSFLKNALEENWQKQYAFASYFSHVTRDQEARQRWKDYAEFITKTHEDTTKLEAETAKAVTALAKLNPSDPKYADLSAKADQAQSQLDFNKAILKGSTVLSIRGGICGWRHSLRGRNEFDPTGLLMPTIGWQIRSRSYRQCGKLW
jgi:hypothetical protein